MTQQYLEDSAANKRAIYEGWLTNDPALPHNYLTTLNTTYQDFQASGTLLAITVIPDKAEMMFFPGDFNPARALCPVEDETGVGKQCTRSFVAFWGRAGEHWTAATELTFNGGIYSVKKMQDFDGDQARARQNFRPCADFIARSVIKYVDCLRDRTMYSPLLVGVSLLGVRNCQPAQDGTTARTSDPVSEDRQDIRASMVMIPAYARLRGIVAAAEILKPVLRQIRHGLRTPPLFSFDTPSVKNHVRSGLVVL